ncbi:hypothetical protein [Collimonas silvisoli]|uniref:hypothetical protein n=1 Tax=Collimonas silvisoli TaxID=2825884 RepID=UPI001B8D77EA|nr:hypothetical protein [Collimonas silvisoli]
MKLMLRNGETKEKSIPNSTENIFSSASFNCSALPSVPSEKESDGRNYQLQIIAIGTHNSQRYFMPSTKKHPKKTAVKNHNPLLDSIFGPDEPEKPQTYSVRLVCELPYPDRPIPGLLKVDVYCFKATPDMVEYGEKLAVELEAWKVRKDNRTLFTIHHAKCPRWKNLVLYIEIHPSKYYSGGACAEHVYEDFKKHIRSLPAYQLVR